MDGNRAVLYLRLSKEDVDKLKKGDDSASIKNQRLLLTDFALERGYQIIDVYSDDNESGLYDNRPEFERMIEDTKLDKFDIIIAKSQSRFSRNMEHIEKLLHHDFLLFGIRFIGVTDNTDTKDIGNKKSRQINGLVNEWYCEDLSKNIRSVFKVKMKAGQFLGSSCAYGYIKDPYDHNHLLIDDYAAEVVRRIYDLYLQGYGKGKIGAQLSKEGVLIPTLYKREVLEINYNNARILDTTKTWSYQTIHHILNNQVYIGNMIQNKYNKISYKDKKVKRLPKEQWITVEGTHESIIDKNTWERVQERQSIRTRSVINRPDGLFSGKLFCADCKHSMSRNYARRGGNGFIGYICKIYKTKGKQFCLSHAILNEDLERAVLRSIKAEAKKILNEDDLDELSRYEVCKEKKITSENQMKGIKKQISKIQNYKQGALEQYLDKVISKTDFDRYVEDYESKIKEFQKQLDSLKKEEKAEVLLNNMYDEWVEAFKDYINIEKLDKNIVNELIKRIEVNEDGSIVIYYRFCNPFI